MSNKSIGQMCIDDYCFRSLLESDKSSIHKLLYFSFEQYNTTVYKSYDSFCAELKRAFVDVNHSYGAFDKEDNLVGVILNSLDLVYAFDYITAVHPDHRGKKIAKNLFEYTLNDLKSRNIAAYRSEIFTSNVSAYDIFTKLGMHKTRELATFKGDISFLNDKYTRVKKVRLDEFDGDIPNDIDHLPSFENVTRIINKNKEYYDLYYFSSKITNRIVGYAIVQRDKSIIRQFNVEEMLFRNWYAKQLFIKISYDHKNIKIKDVDVDWNWIINIYNKFKLVETNRVHEMEIVLNTRDEYNT